MILIDSATDANGRGARRVFRDGSYVELTRTEFDIFAVLWKAKKQVETKQLSYLV
jgi:hypothetical protein